jgi:hypothetical protein
MSHKWDQRFRYWNGLHCEENLRGPISIFASPRQFPRRLCGILVNMSTPSRIEASAGQEETSEQKAEVSSITWKREYKGRMITIFGSAGLGWNAQIDKREPIILGLTRPRAIKHAKDLIDEEQAKYHSRSAPETSRHGKLLPGSKDRSFPTVISADRRRG